MQLSRKIVGQIDGNNLLISNANNMIILLLLGVVIILLLPYNENVSSGTDINRIGMSIN